MEQGEKLDNKHTGLRGNRLIFSVCGLAVSAAALFAYSFLFKSPKAVHYHAGFRVYVNGVRQDFSDMKYMNFTACSEHDTKKSRDEEQMEKAHLHDGIGDVVHVHRDGGTWDDLFRNINFTFPSGDVKAYRNGVPVSRILRQEIQNGESIIIVAGGDKGVDMNDYVSPEKITEVEAKSELCGS